MHGIGPNEAGVHFAMPLLVYLFANAVICGPLNVYLTSSRVGFSLRDCRRFFTVVGFVGSSVGFTALAITRSSDPLWTTIWFTVANGFAAFHPSGFKTNYMDVARHNSGALSGVGNTVATAASYLMPIVVDRLRISRGWPSVFVVVVIINIAAATFFGLASTVTPLDVTKDE